jgi:hypothetical protein
MPRRAVRRGKGNAETGDCEMRASPEGGRTRGPTVARTPHSGYNETKVPQVLLSRHCRRDAMTLSGREKRLVDYASCVG